MTCLEKIIEWKSKQGQNHAHFIRLFVMLICSHFCLKKQKNCREFKVLTFIVACVVFRVLALDRLKYHRKYQHSTDLTKEHHALGGKNKRNNKDDKGDEDDVLQRL